MNKGKLYIGESAGAIILSEDIFYCSKLDDIKKAPFLYDTKGLGLIDFFILPHYKSFKYGKAVKETMSNLKLDYKYIRDNQCIYIEGEKVEILDKK